MTSEVLTRRGLLRGASARAAAAALAGLVPARMLASGFAEAPPGLLAVKEFQGLTAPFSQSTDRVAHLLHRTTYGVRPGELERARKMGADAWLDEQLHPERIDDSEVEANGAALFPTLGLSPQQLFDQAQKDNDGGYKVAWELKRATLYRALFSKRQLYQRMVEFWSNHFSMYHFKDDVAVLKTVDDREVTRPLALGRFRDLLQASAKSPAMLFYLDNYLNVADGPNENYARELMELHTVGVDAGYSQQDVREVARCFTGWTIDYRGQGTDGEFLFDPGAHDPGQKTFLGAAIAGGDPGIKDGEQVLDILAGHPSCAGFISTKLCRHFGADVPPSTLVDKVAATFTATAGDLRAVLRTLLTSKEFYAAAEQKLRRPYEFAVAALRTLGADVASGGLDQILWSLSPLGQVPFEWEPPNGYPDVGAAWANTNGLLNRWNLSSAIVLGWFDGVQVPIDGIVARSAARTPVAFVDFVAGQLLQRRLDPADHARLVDYVAQGGKGTTRVPAGYLHDQAPGLLALILGSPYFQWR